MDKRKGAREAKANFRKNLILNSMKVKRAQTRKHHRQYNVYTGTRTKP